MATRRKGCPQETPEGQDSQETLDAPTEGELADMRRFQQGRYAQSAEDVYAAIERLRMCNPAALERELATDMLAQRVIAKAAQK